MKTVKRKLEEWRPWIAKYFYYIFLLMGLLITFLGGLYPYYLYYSAPNYSFEPGFSGFGVARNQTNILPWMMVVGIGVDPPDLWFQYFFQCSINGTYNFIFVFPFNVISKISATENMSFRTTSRGSAIWLRYEVNDISVGWASKEIWGYFSIENTFQSGTRGSYTFLLPFGMGIHPEVYGNLQRELNVPFHTPDTNITLQFGLPGHYKITGTFPPVSAGPNVWITPTNRSIETVEWEFETLRDSVTVQCQDPNEASYYQSLPFISGLGLSIGASIATRTIYDAVKEWASPSQTRVVKTFNKARRRSRLVYQRMVRRPCRRRLFTKEK